MMWHGAVQAIGAVLALQAMQLPQPRGYVNDFANILPAESEARLTRIIDDVRAKSGGEIVVVTLPTIGDRHEADVAREIGRQWGVGRGGEPGDPARNTGVILLLVPRQDGRPGTGRIRIETGLGAEGFITDGTAGAIRDEAGPLLAQEQYGPAAELMTQRIAGRFAGEFGFTVEEALAPPPRGQPVRQPGGGGLPALWVLIMFMIIISLISRGGRRGRRRGVGGLLPWLILMNMGGRSRRGGGFGGGGAGGRF